MLFSLWRSLFRPTSRDSPDADVQAHPSPALSTIDRAAIQTAAVPSVTTRIQRFLGLGLLGALTLVFLGYYYAHAFARSRSPVPPAHATAAQGESTLPPLESAPHAAPFHEPTAALPASPPSNPSPYLVGNVLTDNPSAPGASTDPDLAAIEHASAPHASVSQSPTQPTTPRPSANERRLSGAVFARSSTSTPPSPQAPPDRDTLAAELAAYTNAAPPSSDPAAPAANTNSPPLNPLDALLKPRLTTAVAASLLPTQRLLLPKGAFIDCTLETAIDSTLPGLTTCLTAVDTYSADGRVVLLERGTKLIGETRGSVEQGASRLFVLWTEARTPNGVVVNLDSPGTDELGRAGLAGQVNRHFADRFGAAILVSMIDGAIQGATQNSRSSGASVTYNATGSRDVLTEVLKSTINIPPTLTKQQGDRIQILVARDLDFRSVYALYAR